MSEGFDFLGFRIQWRRKRGTGKWYVYTFIDDRPIRAVKAKIRAPTRRTSQQDLGYVLTRLNQVMRGWANYFRHAVSKNAFGMLDNFAWWRVIRMLRAGTAGDGRTSAGISPPPPGGGCRHGGEIEMRRIAAIPVTRYRYRGSKIPTPWTAAAGLTAGTVESPVREKRTAGSASGPGKRAGSNAGTAPRAYLT